jgi:hypothetical protein
MKYVKLYEEFNLDIDPYSEEDWNEPIIFNKMDKVRILPKLKEYIGKGWPDHFIDFIGAETRIDNPYWISDGIKCCLVSAGFNTVRNANGYIIPLDCVEKI